MHPAVEIGQGEIGRLKRSQRGAPRVVGLAEEPDRVLVVMHDRQAELARQRGQVDQLVAQELFAAAGRDRNAALAATDSLRFEFPAGRGLQLRLRHPEMVAARLGASDAYRSEERR